MARRSLWRRLRRATRDPRNAALARAIGGFSRALGALPMPAALAVGPGLGTAAHALLATPRRLALAPMRLACLGRDDPRFVAAVGDALRRNRVVAMLIDQDTRGAGVFVPFFGRPAHTPPGAALLALRARVPVVTTFIERRPEGGHLVRVSPVPAGLPRGREGVRELTARLTAAIEAQIRRSPAEWVWWHERWRKQPSAAAMRRPAATAERALS